MTVVLSFLRIFSLRKAITFFNISENLQENQEKKNCVSGISWAFKSKLQIVHVATYIEMFLPRSNNCFLICLVRYIHICLYYFLIFCFCFHLFSLTLLATRQFYNLQCLIRFCYNLTVTLRK